MPTINFLSDFRVNLLAAFMNNSREPGLFTSRDYSSDKEAACEGVVLYVEQAATKSMP